MPYDVDTARRLLSPHFATDGEEDGPEAERITTAVDVLIGSIAEALSIAREEGRRPCGQIAYLAVDNFERQMTRDEEVALARRILAFVPDDYTDDQLADIGKRARHWVLKKAVFDPPRKGERAVGTTLTVVVMGENRISTEKCP